MHQTLSLIIEGKKKRLDILYKNKDGILSLLKKALPVKDFKKAIMREGKLSFIAEIKQASPAVGILRKDFDPVKIAKIYKENGAHAISVVTEEEFFLGKLNHVGEVKKASDLPVLRKDFILDEIQVYESRAAGADALMTGDYLTTQGRLPDDDRQMLADLGLELVQETAQEEGPK